MRSLMNAAVQAHAAGRICADTAGRGAGEGGFAATHARKRTLAWVVSLWMASAEQGPDVMEGPVSTPPNQRLGHV